MIHLADLPEVIPVFPLPGALLLPRARLPLHIFEPRYVAMIDDALKSSHRLIGMIQPRPSTGDDARLAEVGCVGRLTNFSETDDGRYMITLTGLIRFRVQGEVPGFPPYRRAAIDWADFAQDLTPDTDDDFDREAFYPLLARYFQARKLGSDWSGLREAGPEQVINTLSMLLPLSPEDKQALLEAPSLAERRRTLITLLEFALHSTNFDEVLQ